MQAVYMFNTSLQLKSRDFPRVKLQGYCTTDLKRVWKLNSPRCKTIFGIAWEQTNIRDIFLLRTKAEFATSFAIRESDFSESANVYCRFSAALFFRVLQNFAQSISSAVPYCLKKITATLRTSSFTRKLLLSCDASCFTTCNFLFSIVF